MSDQNTLFSKIGSWFKRGGTESSRGGNGTLPLEDDSLNRSIEPRSTFLKPWGRRDQQIQQALQDSFNALTDLMTSLRDNLQRQGERQDELLKRLGELPEVMQSIPDSNRVQSETLRAIHQQLEQQQVQEHRLGEILEKISDTGSDQKEILDVMRDRMDSLKQYDQAISENLSSVGSAMQSVSQSSSTSTEVLQQIRDNLQTRDTEIEKVLQRQGTRFTTMLAIATFLSIAALVAVGVIGYLLLTR